MMRNDQKNMFKVNILIYTQEFAWRSTRRAGDEEKVKHVVMHCHVALRTVDVINRAVRSVESARNMND